MSTIKVHDEGALPGVLDGEDRVEIERHPREEKLTVSDFISSPDFDDMGSPSERLDMVMRSNPDLKVSAALTERAALLTREYHFDLFPGRGPMASRLRKLGCRSFEEAAQTIMISDVDISLEMLNPRCQPDDIKSFLSDHPRWTYWDLIIFNNALGNEPRRSREFYLPTEQVVAGLKDFVFEKTRKPGELLQEKM